MNFSKGKEYIPGLSFSLLDSGFFEENNFAAAAAGGGGGGILMTRKEKINRDTRTLNGTLQGHSHVSL